MSFAVTINMMDIICCAIAALVVLAAVVIVRCGIIAGAIEKRQQKKIKEAFKEDEQ